MDLENIQDLNPNIEEKPNSLSLEDTLKFVDTGTITKKNKKSKSIILTISIGEK
jgi:hypothetical protein